MIGLTAVRAGLVFLLVGAPAALAQEKSQKVKPQGGMMSASASNAKMKKMSNAELIRSALAAAPHDIAEHAAVIAPDASGKMAEIHAGTNGWTCIADEPDTPGVDPMCLDKQSMMWVQSLMSHAAKPANTAPGIVYMLQGGSDISATDPFATKTDHYVDSPPHYMIMWPYDAKATGFSTTPKKTGTWIMWAGTPYAHLMINGKP
jgi:hypothetical protein